ncbi:hypothetical protein NXC12_PE00600 (plasmid) [Rhizobium etli]|uniref:Uncharacterized protein n=1 Tax=Rhizobium etli TaxID=29449 RepID=A0AAN1BMY8_RHIET|nr:hypothetical protein REMIM1_PF00446 [Rhizobium etli bv. mimosae str. Mim1]ARQ14194.1 hypothetical protein NXC12_PE00600 [Rhizobium etli]
MPPAKSLTVLLAVAAIWGQTSWARAEAVGRPTDIILSVSPRTGRQATVHKVPDPGEDDPYYHVEVIVKERRTPPWQFKRLANPCLGHGQCVEQKPLATKSQDLFLQGYRIPDRLPELARAAPPAEGGGCLPHDDPQMRRHRRQALGRRKSRLQNFRKCNLALTMSHKTTLARENIVARPPAAGWPNFPGPPVPADPDRITPN